MHPVLVYALIAIVSAIALLPIFEAYQLGSFNIYVLVVIVITIALGKLFIFLFPYHDPMQVDVEKEKNIRKTRSYKREIQMLFNIVQPDPKMQPAIRRLDGELQEYFLVSESEMLRRIRAYFGEDFDIELQQPLVNLIEAIQQRYPNWPQRLND